MELPGKTPLSTFFQNKQESKLISGKTLRQQVGPRRSGKGESTNPAKNPQSTSCQHLATLQDGRSRQLEGGDPSPIRSSVWGQHLPPALWASGVPCLSSTQGATSPQLFSLQDCIISTLHSCILRSWLSTWHRVGAKKKKEVLCWINEESSSWFKHVD